MKSIWLFILLFPICFYGQSNPCDFSNNLGRSLEVVFSSCNDALSSGIGCSFFIEKLDIDVSCDDPLKLVVQLDYNGDEGVVLIQPLNLQKKQIDKFKPSIFKLSPDRISSYEIELDTNSTENLTSVYLQLTFAETKRKLNRPSPFYIFSLKKRWCNAPSCSSSKNKSILVVSANATPLSNAQNFNPVNLRKRCGNRKTMKNKEKEIYSKGPSSKKISLNSLVKSDLVENVSNLFGIEYVFEDEEIKSGYFYWYPEKYSLKWTMEDGFSAKNIYSSKTESDENDIQFYAELITGIDSEKLKSIQSILAIYAKEKYDIEEVTLLPLPISKNPSFHNNWKTMFGVEPIAILQGNDISSSVKIEFNVSQNNMAKIGVALLNELGLSGSLEFTPINNLLPKINIPLEISLHPKSQYLLGPNEIRSGSREKRYWKNSACHPLEVETINFLVLNHSPSCQPNFVVYSWKLFDKEGDPIYAPGKSNLYIGLDETLKVLLKDQKKVFARWLDFEVLEKNECNAQIINQLIANSFDLKGAITVEQILLFEQIPDIQRITVKVRSYQFSFSENQKITKEISFTAAGQSKGSIGPVLFTKNKRTPYYDYQVVVVKEDGEKYTSSWISEEGDLLTIGTNIIKKKVKGFKWE